MFTDVVRVRSVVIVIAALYALPMSANAGFIGSAAAFAFESDGSLQPFDFAMEVRHAAVVVLACDKGEARPESPAKHERKIQGAPQRQRGMTGGSVQIPSSTSDAVFDAVQAPKSVLAVYQARQEICVGRIVIPQMIFVPPRSLPWTGNA
jgi:hypothetical protein